VGFPGGGLDTDDGADGDLVAGEEVDELLEGLAIAVLDCGGEGRG
jgi:hypothetical protein